MHSLVLSTLKCLWPGLDCRAVTDYSDYSVFASSSEEEPKCSTNNWWHYELPLVLTGWWYFKCHINAGLHIKLKLIFTFFYFHKGHVETCLWLPGHMGSPNWGQLQGCDSGTSHWTGQNEEPHYQALEAHHRLPHPCQLSGSPTELRFQPLLSRWLCHIKTAYITWLLEDSDTLDYNFIHFILKSPYTFAQ